MKKLIAALFIVMLMAGMAIAENDGVTIKQHIIYTWDGMEAKNVTSATVLKTKPIDGLPNWANMMIDGWCIDAGAAYEDDTIRDAAILVGREFGTLGKYVPWLIFPFKDRIQITLDIAGVYLPDIKDHLQIEGASGFGYIKGSLKF